MKPTTPASSKRSPNAATASSLPSPPAPLPALTSRPLCLPTLQLLLRLRQPLQPIPRTFLLPRPLPLLPNAASPPLSQRPQCSSCAPHFSQLFIFSRVTAAPPNRPKF